MWKTVDKRVEWECKVGRVRAALWRFERAEFRGGEEVEGLRRVEHGLLISTGTTFGVWLRSDELGDLRGLVEEVGDCFAGDEGVKRRIARAVLESAFADRFFERRRGLR